MMMSFVGMLEVVLLFLLYPPGVYSIEEAFCAGIGFSNGSDKDNGLKSMGASSLFHHPLNTIWGANVMDAPRGRSDVISVVVNNVEQTFPDGKRRQMMGWLYLKIKKRQGHFVALAVTALDNGNQPFGEFIHLQASDSAASVCDVWKDGKNYIPCSAVPLGDSWNPNMFVYTNPGSDPVDIINLLWRASVTYCSKPINFKFIFATNSDKWDPYSGVSPFNVQHGNQMAVGTAVTKTDLGAMLFSTASFILKFYGVASPRYPGAPIFCNGANMALEDTKPDWLQNAFSGGGAYGGILGDVPVLWLQERWDFQTGLEQNAVVIRRATCKAAESGFVDFGGRCEGGVNTVSRTFASMNKSAECYYQPNSFNNEDWKYFRGKHTAKVESRASELATSCGCPTVPTETEVIQQRQRKVITDPILISTPYDSHDLGCLEHSNKSRDGHGLCVTSESGHVAYSLRRWHAILALFYVVVANPAVAFIARYFKGSIPVTPETGEPYIQVKKWYTAHIFLVVPIICVGVCTFSIISRQRVAVGFSNAPFAIVHRIAGWTYCGLYIFQIVTGFLRPLKMSARKCAIFLHWFMGLLVIYGGVAICILTYLIPASPSSTVVHLYTNKFNLIYNHPPPMTLVCWILIDILFHTFLTVRLRLVDKKNDIQRTYFPVFLPVRVGANELLFEEMFKKETRFHYKCFILYLFFCTSFFVAVVMAMTVFNEYRDQGFGDMFCTHKDGKFIVPLEGETNPTLDKFFVERRCGVIFNKKL